MAKYIIDYYSLSDCQHTTTIEAETPKDAEIKLRQFKNVDYVISMSIDTRVMINTLTHCLACQRLLTDCDCIPL